MQWPKPTKYSVDDDRTRWTMFGLTDRDLCEWNNIIMIPFRRSNINLNPLHTHTASIWVLKIQFVAVRNEIGCRNATQRRTNWRSNWFFSLLCQWRTNSFHYLMSIAIGHQCRCCRCWICYARRGFIELAVCILIKMANTNSLTFWFNKFDSIDIGLRTYFSYFIHI